MNIADTIYYNGRILTVDADFSVAEALAISKGIFSAVGSNDDIMSLSSENTILIDLEGRTVIPGLNDSHLHPTIAAVSELNDEIPDIHSLKELINWIEYKADKLAPGKWIVHPKFFVTRIKERRYPLLSDLDSAAPNNPVFLDGSYSGMVNTYALKCSGLIKKDLHPGILIDFEHKKISGIIRPKVYPLLAYKKKSAVNEEHFSVALEEMLRRYNRVGITNVTDGQVNPAEKELYLTLKREQRLSMRVNLCLTPDFLNPKKDADEIVSEVKDFGGQGDEFVRTGPLKVLIDGGILTGTASNNKPWGKKCQEIFGFDGSNYYGHLNYTQEQLTEIAIAAVKYDWKFTAHCVGDKALDMLLTAYEEADKIKKIKDLRWSVIHGNFFNSAAIKRAGELGIVIECQIMWFYKDASYIEYILGNDYKDIFLPLNSMIKGGLRLAGGSDHMVKFDPVSSINPYNPFLSIQTMVTREVEEGRVINKDEAISREDALKLYTINGAYATGEEERKGSIEPGKLADMVILDTDFLTCDENTIKDIKVETTILGGTVVFQA